MPSRFQPSEVSTDTPLVTTAETIVATSDTLSTSTGSDRIALAARVNVTAGTGTTSIQFRVRKGTLVTGALVDELVTLTIAAGNTDDMDFEVIDTPGDVAGQQYVLTAQQVAATANGTVNHASLDATIGR